MALCGFELQIAAVEGIRVHMRFPVLVMLINIVTYCFHRDGDLAHQPDFRLQRQMPVSALMQRILAGINTRKPLNHPTVDPQEFNHTAVNAKTAQLLKIHIFGDQRAEPQRSVDPSFLQSQERSDPHTGRAGMFIQGRMCIVQTGDTDLDVRQLRIKDGKIFRLCGKMRFGDNQITNSGLIQGLNCLICDFMRRFTRLETVCHAAQTDNTPAGQPADFPAHFFNIRDTGLRWIPESTEIKQCPCIAVTAVVLATAAVCIQPCIITAFGPLVPANYLVKAFVLVMASRSFDVLCWILRVARFPGPLESPPFPKLMILPQMTGGFERRYAPDPYAT